MHFDGKSFLDRIFKIQMQNKTPNDDILNTTLKFFHIRLNFLGAASKFDLLCRAGMEL